MDIIFEASPLAFGVDNALARTGISRVCAQTLKALDVSLSRQGETRDQYYIYSSASRWHNILLYVLAREELKLEIIQPLIDPCDLPLIARIELHNGLETSSLKHMILELVPDALLAREPCFDYLNTQAYIFINSYLATPSVVRMNQKASVVHHIHDIFPITRPSLFHPGLDEVWRRKVSDFCEKDTFVCISQSTARDLLRFIPYLNNDAVSVIYNSGNHAADWCEVTPIDMCGRFGVVESQYFLTVSTLEPRKDLPLLLDAFTQFKQQDICDYKLVIIGSTGWLGEAESKFLDRFSNRSDIIFAGRLADNELFALIQTAAAYISTARCEGFGLGLAEAMALGCLPIAPNNTSQTEVIEGIGYLYNGKDDLVACMHRTLKGEFNQQDIIAASSQRFSWARSSEQWLRLIQSISTCSTGN